MKTKLITYFVELLGFLFLTISLFWIGLNIIKNPSTIPETLKIIVGMSLILIQMLFSYRMVDIVLNTNQMLRKYKTSEKIAFLALMYLFTFSILSIILKANFGNVWLSFSLALVFFSFFMLIGSSLVFLIELLKFIMSFEKIRLFFKNYNELTEEELTGLLESRIPHWFPLSERMDSLEMFEMNLGKLEETFEELIKSKNTLVYLGCDETFEMEELSSNLNEDSEVACWDLEYTDKKYRLRGGSIIGLDFIGYYNHKGINLAVFETFGNGIFITKVCGFRIPKLYHL